MWKLLREQNIHENKKALRARCREIVKGLSPEYIEDASHKIASLVLATDAYKKFEYDFLLHVDGRRASDG